MKYHCSRCGVVTYSRGDADYMGGPFVCVFVTTLDDASPEELLSGPIRYSDGLNNDWTHQPAEIRHLQEPPQYCSKKVRAASMQYGTSST